MNKNVEIKETEEGVEVNLYPDMLVEPLLKDKPYDGGDDVKVDYGKIGGKIVPIRARYKGKTPEEVIKDDHEILDNRVECPACERNKRQLLLRLKNATDKGETKEEKRQFLSEEIKQIKVEHERLKAKKPKEEPVEKYEKKTPEPSPFEPQKITPLPERMQESVKGARNEVNTLLRQVFTPPVLPTPKDVCKNAAKDMGIKDYKF